MNEDTSKSYTIINRNHRKVLLESHSIQTWPCRMISLEAVTFILIYFDHITSDIF
jgi:hypothetical protein